MSNDDFKPREMEIMAKAWVCIEGDIKRPKVDYVKLATMCGMTNKGSTSNAWSAIKKKIIARGGSGDTNGFASNGDAKGGAADGTPAKPTPKKRAAGKVEKEDGESPTKKAKGERKSKAQKAAEEAAAAEEDGEGSGSLVKGEPGGDDLGFE
ncbi:hypothetical protein LTS09_012350 [Friedmanniomyces endolithicus]|nr:hypothetical protein LTS09_012350 [Friedmanniomyces endolithicus]